MLAHVQGARARSQVTPAYPQQCKRDRRTFEVLGKDGAVQSYIRSRYRASLITQLVLQLTRNDHQPQAAVPAAPTPTPPLSLLLPMLDGMLLTPQIRQSAPPRMVSMFSPVVLTPLSCTVTLRSPRALNRSTLLFTCRPASKARGEASPCHQWTAHKQLQGSQVTGGEGPSAMQ